MSCLFDSISYFLRLNSFETRKKICDYLEENNQLIDGLDTKLLLDMENPNYIRNMRSTTTWGGALEIKCACNIWNIRIMVRIRENNKVIEFLPTNNRYIGTIDLEWTGNHYEAIIRN